MLALIMITVMMFSMNSVSVLASGTDSSEDIAQDNLKLWLKADDGVTESNGVVSSWKNQVDSSEFLPVNDTAGVTLNADGETGYKYLKFDGTEALKGSPATIMIKRKLQSLLLGNTRYRSTQRFLRGCQYCAVLGREWRLGLYESGAI